MLPPGIKTADEPASARLTNLLLGGTYHTAADEAAAAELERACPQVRRMALDGRLFTVRVVAWAADQGISQFLDLGAGISPGPAVHDVARSVRPGSRVCYVDNDPEVTDWLRDVMPGGDSPGVAVVNADLRHAAALWRDSGLREVIDTRRPVLVILSLALHLLAAAGARKAVSSYARLIAPGSYVAVSVPCVADELARKRMDAAFPACVRNFTPAEVGAMLGGLEIEPPGIAPTPGLRPGWGEVPGRDPGPAYILGGIGRKPAPGRVLSAGRGGPGCAGEQLADIGQARAGHLARRRGAGLRLAGVRIIEDVAGEVGVVIAERGGEPRHPAGQLGAPRVGGDVGHQGAEPVEQSVHPVPQPLASCSCRRFVACRFRHHAVRPPQTLALPGASPVRRAPPMRLSRAT